MQLKELGFDEPCFGCHEEIENRDYKVILEVTKSIGINTLNGIRNYNQEDEVSAPTYSQVFRWFREKHGLFIKPNRTIDSGGIWYYFSIETKRTDICEGSFVYEEAELSCLRKLIEIVKKKKSI